MPKSKNVKTGNSTFKKAQVDRRRKEQKEMRRQTEQASQAGKRSSNTRRNHSWF